MTAAGGRVKRLWRGLHSRYFTVDPRAAGLFRIVFGTFLILDCIRHWMEIGFLYSNDGVLSNHTHLFKPTSGNGLSIFHAFSATSEVHVLFALGLICHIFYTVGYRTRLFAILTCIWVVSRDTRIPFVENGGYVVQNLLCFWGCFLPIERRFSIDAWRRSLSLRRESSVMEINAGGDPSGWRGPIVSMIGLIIIVNVAVVYLFNVLNKMGHLWRRGDAVHYVLHLDRMVTGLGVFVRENFPPFMVQAADYGALVVEATIFVCIASPRARFYARPIAIVLMCLLHTTFGTFMRLGPFSWCLICWSVLLLLPVHFESARRFYERRSKKCTLLVDESQAFAMLVARVIRRLDPRGRVTIEAAREEGVPLAIRDESGKVYSDSSTLWLSLTEALTFGRWLRRGVALVSFGTVPLIARWALGHGAVISRFWGLKVGGHEQSGASPMRERMARWTRWLKEASLVYLAIAATYQLFLENKMIPKTLPPPLKEGQELQPDEKWALELVKKYVGSEVITLKPDAPKIMQITIGYTRTFQGWGMFAPNPIQEDGILTVDAFTLDGRRVDPLTGAPPILDLKPLRGAGLSQLRQDYGNRIRLDRNAGYRDGLKDYLLRYHLRTGNPGDELIGFDVYWVRDKCPKPPSNQPYDNDAVPLLSYRRPNAEALAREVNIKLPPVPKVRSAEKW